MRPSLPSEAALSKIKRLNHLSPWKVLSFRIYAYLLSGLVFSFESYNTFLLCEKCIVCAYAYIDIA